MTTLETSQILTPAELEARAYWLGRLSNNELAASGLDFASPRAHTFPGRTASFSFAIDEATLRQLERVTESKPMLMHAAITAAVLATSFRRSGRGTQLAGCPPLREHAGGANALPIAVQLSPAQNFRELLIETRRVLLEAHARADYPYRALIAALGRDEQAAPLFDVAIELAPLHGPLFDAQHELNLAFELGATPAGIAAFNPARLSEASVRSFVQQALHFLHAGLSDSSRMIGSIELEPRAQSIARQRRLSRALRELEVTDVVDAFEAQVRRAPEQIAVIDAHGEATSYDALDRRANAVAEVLLACGAGADTFVGIYVERSVEMVAAALGVWKAGAAYVPLDPAHPEQRVRALIDERRMPVVLAGRELPKLEVNAEWIELERIRASTTTTELRRPKAIGEGAAYVLYTSGTTGLPKGAIVSRSSVNQLVAGLASEYAITPADRLLQFASFTFDAAVEELFVTLTRGATLVLRPGDAIDSPQRFFEVCAARAITVVDLPAAYWHELCRSEAIVPPGVRVLIAGGQRVDPQCVASWFARHASSPRLINVYGPTECTVVATTADIERRAYAEVPIGRCLPGVSAWVLDRRLAPVAEGELGEIYLGGGGVGRGYAGAPAMTAEKFLPDPFGAPGARLYRTGDLGRVRSDGSLEVAGRADRQVKVRGFRVQPEEVEACLARDPEVREVVVVARAIEGHDHELIAYVASSSADAKRLRDRLRAELPFYMIPAVIEILPALPHNTSDKVDLHALPEPDEARPYTAPKTETERALAAIWEQVLELDRVGRDDDFFELGGHSLLAARVMSRVGSELRIEAPLSLLFDAPTVHELAGAIEARARIAEEPSSNRENNAALPLSFAQRRLWFVQSLDEQSSLYNIPARVLLRGPLDVERFDRSLASIIERHEALRACFEVSAGEPLQTIAATAPIRSTFIDLRSRDEASREAEIERLREEEARRPFDLRRAPLLRATILAHADQLHTLLFTLHHIVADGWSIGVFLRELNAIYGALERGTAHGLPPPAIGYAESIRWQLSRGASDRERAYWKDRLFGAPLRLELPTDRPRPAVESHRGTSQSFRFPRALEEELERFATRENATAFMVLLAAFQVLLHRYSGQEDIVVGAPVANRPRPELESLIGFFVNMVALRTDLRGRPSFRALLARVRETVLGALAHQEVPFEKVVEAVQPERSLSHTPIFQVAFAHDNTAPLDRSIGSLALSIPEQRSQGARFELTLSITREGAQLEYNSDLFDAETIARMIAHYTRLLRAVLDAPETSIDRLPMLAPDERRALLIEKNDTEKTLPDRPAQVLIAERAKMIPAVIALRDGAASISYGELDRRVARLARQLVIEGVQPEDRVLLLIDRGIDYAIAMLAVLHAGAAFVPLNPTHPASRHAEIAAQTRARLMLIDAGNNAEIVGLRALSITALSERPDAPATLPSVHLRQLACVFFTSGSTGKPKGAMIEHRGMLNHLLAKVEDLSLDHRDRVAQNASQAFDISVWQYLSALLGGGSVEVLGDRLAERPDAVLEAIDARAITVLETVPSFLRAMLEHLEASKTRPALSTLRIMISNAESLPWELYRRFAALYPRIAAYNTWGATECSDDVTHEKLDPAAPEDTAYVTIGVPLSNIRIYIVDQHLEPVPRGVIGELCIGDLSVGRGYDADPQRTAVAFIPDPFSREPGARMYRTGDLGRYTRHDTLEFIGRRDKQIKIRGHRVEIGEIEAALSAAPGVRANVVLVREDVPSMPKIVAYVTAGELFDPLELHSFLAARLPSHMLPSAIVTLEALPLNDNGKIDRPHLPPPGEADFYSASVYTAPENEAEERVAQIFSQLLELPRVGRDDDFFGLGGHSLLASRLTLRMREAFGIELPMLAVFEAPTVAELAERVRTERGSALEDDAWNKLDRGAFPPLSFAQQRLWFLDQLEPNSPFYNIPAMVEIEGALDAEALQRAIRSIVRRHEILRTNFVLHDGQPYQRVHAELEVPLIVEEANAERAAQILAQPFSLAEGPLLRAHLLRKSATAQLLVVSMHHIISDGWSEGLLIRELNRAYAEELGGEVQPRPPLALQYADFSVWQRRWLTDQRLEAQLEYWGARLSGQLPTLDLPSDRPRPRVMTYRGALYDFELDRRTVERLRPFAEAHRSTTFMTLLAALKIVLARYCRQNDVIVGVPIAGRPRLELEEMLGFFANTLAMRTDLSGNPTFSGLIDRVRETALGAFAHQDLPFEKLVEHLNAPRDLSRAPVFQVMMMHQNAGNEALRLGEARCTRVEPDVPIAKFDLTLFVIEREDAFEVSFEYNSDLFDRTTIARLARHYALLLAGALERPETRILDLPMLPEDERRRVLVEWNRSEFLLPDARPIHRVFEDQAERNPDATAVVFEDRHLSYRTLNEHANRIANRLIALGVRPDSLVGLSLRRSPEMVAGYLGVLKSGCAYVPIDPAYPPERQALIATDARISVLITEHSLAEPWRARGLPVVTVDEDEAVARAPAINPAVAIAGDNIIYVIYTSGSTGRPKGVAMRHRSLANLIHWQRQATVIRGPARTLQFASMNFDISFQEMMTTFAEGGTIVLISEAVRRDPIALLSLIAERRVERLYLPFVALQHLVEAAEQLDVLPECLLEVTSAGEALQSTPLLRRFFARLPRCVLHNQYGPTECHVVSNYDLAPDPNSWAPLPSVGRPHANTRFYILDTRMQPVPIGVPGELYIAGEMVARGYLHRPELTAAAFIPNPFEAGARFYKTGDLVRAQADGNLDFLGRIDDQLKVRGYRIEPGEVQTALEAHREVRASIVTAPEIKPGDRRLTGYVVRTPGSALEAAELRAFVGARLPHYMVPTFIVFMDALPLTHDGKVNRKLLPQPQPDARKAAFIAPRSPLETALVELYSEVLGVERVSAGDGFFELGGHSLLATRLVSHVRQKLSIELALRTMFEATTPAELAEQIELSMRAGRRFAIPPLVRAPKTDRSPLSFAEERLWFIDQLERGSPQYNMPAAIAISSSEPLDVAMLERCFLAILERHEVLRSAFLNEGERVLLPLEAFRLQVIDLRDRPDARARAQSMIDEDARRVFELARGPLVSMRLYRLDAQNELLSLNVHHILCDGWSIGIFLRELEEEWTARRSGRAPQHAVLPVQYADYAIWQRGWMSEAVLERELEYWRRELRDPPILQLPLDHPRPRGERRRGRSIAFTLPSALTAGLNALGKREGATSFMILLGAFQTVLARTAGQDEVIVGAPVAGRTLPELEGLIGFFANTLPFRARLQRNPSVRELLRQIRETTLAAHDHQNVPFQKLVEELGSGPLFQALLMVQEGALRELSLPGLSSTPIDPDNQTAKFDLTLIALVDRERFELTLEYDAELFAARSMERLVARLRMILEGFVAAPETRIFDLPVHAEGPALLREAYDRENFLHLRFEANAAHDPSATALIFGTEQRSYAELDRRANRIASGLLARGIGRESRVAINLDRSFELIAAVLAVVKAGAVFVPIDPAYPAARRALILEDARAELVLTAETAAELAAIGTEAPCSAPWSFDQLLYIIYTSGSTGQPKGVAMTHGALINLIDVQCRSTTLRDRPRTLQFSAIGFDAFVQELFTALSEGGALVLIGDEQRRDPQLVWTAIAAAQVQRLFLPFVALQQLAEAAAELRALPESLAEIITAGEQLVKTPQLTAMMKRLPRAVLVNQYGPIETHVVTEHVLARAPESWSELPPIGRALRNTAAYVLDTRMQLAPIGVPGELYLGGDALARGYLDQRRATAEKFLPDPFQPGRRMYRTGDRARVLENGELEFLGRLDQQVKIRGYRVEPAEIEAVLQQHPRVESAVVVARGAPHRRLIACITLRDRAPSEAEPRIEAELRELARARLPDYLVPSAFTVFEALPLGANGKVDRLALAKQPIEPAKSATAETSASPPPRNEREQRLAEAFTELLELDTVGVHDSFFDAGGHSLLAARLASRARKTFGVQLTVRDVFDAPTIAGLAEKIACAAPAEESSIEATPRPARIPASFAQQRLWFVDQLLPNNPAYNIGGAVELRGRLSIDRLERAFQRAIARHESLRTRFALIDGEVIQEIDPSLAFTLKHIDLRGRARGDAELRAKALLNTPFLLSRAPLFDAELMQLEDELHLLVVNMHHIISDAWSVTILIRELARGYAGAPELDAPPPLQYADYALWQRARLNAQHLERHLAYWKTQLGGERPLLAFPTDRPRPPVTSFHGRTLERELSPALRTALESLAREHDATLFMVVFAAFSVLLHQHTGQHELLIGMSVAGRTRPELEGMIGLFANLLAVKTALDPREPFHALLARTRERLLENEAHQEVPFERLIELLGVERDPSRAPLVQAACVLINTPSATMELGDLTLVPRSVESTASKLDFTLSLDPGAGGLLALLEYNTDLFDEATMQRVLDRFQALLTELAKRPHAAIGELARMTDEERTRVLQQRALEEAPIFESVPERFRRVAARRPDAPAIDSGLRAITYRELQQQADRLAHHLRERHRVQRGAKIGLLMERSEHAVIAMLAILEAGAAYVPISPDEPEARLAQIIAGAELELMVIDSSLISLLDDYEGAIFAVDLQLSRLPAAAIPPAIALRGEDLAYTIYTSGTTGTPKGVAVEHRAILGLIARQPYLTIEEGARIAAASPLAFDAATFEIWGALLSGGTVVLVDKEVLLTPGALKAAIRERAIDTLFITTALFNQITKHDPTSFAGLDTLLFGGEATHVERVHDVLRAGRPRRFLNVYGPTECTTFAAWYAIEAAEAAVPIGRALARTTTYVLDGALRPVPLGVEGELYLGGPRLARGYLNRPRETAERFFPNPFGEGRLYRTGDRVRMRADGELLFVGRADHQVKIRGFRIELEEIDRVLRAHPAISEVVAVAVQSGSNKSLAAYVVHPEARLTSAELRSFVAQRLPEWMVPAVFVSMPSLPLTKTGKIDREQLPPPIAPDRETPYIAPRTEAEQRVAEIWAEVLELDVAQIGAEDDYFVLGGDSILSIRVLAELRAAGYQIELGKLFEQSTLAELAAALTPNTAPEISTSSAAFSLISAADRARLPEDAVDAYPLAALQAGMIFHATFARTPVYHDIFTYRIAAPYRAEPLQRALAGLSAAHPILRTSFHLGEYDEPLQIVHRTAELPLIAHALGSLDEAAQREAIRAWVEDRKASAFVWDRAPLFEVHAFVLAPDAYELGFSFSHALLDGWSFTALLGELMHRYRAEVEGKSASIAPPEVPYRDFIAAEKIAVANEASRAFWRTALEGAPFTAIPRLHREAQTIDPSSDRLWRTIDPALATELKARAAEWRLPVKALLTAAHAIALSEVCGERELVTGLTSHARLDRRGAERTLGLHLNTLPLRLDLRGRDPRAIAEAAHAAEEEMLPHRAYPLAQLQRELGGAPLFETSFTYLHFHQLARELEDLPAFDSRQGEAFAQTNFALATTFSLTRGGALELALEGDRAILHREDLARISLEYERALRLLSGRTGRRSLPAGSRGLQIERSGARWIELFEQQVQKTPQAIALETAEAQLDYAALDDRAGRLAHRLQTLGVGPEVLVGVALPRSIEQLVAVLAIAKSGGVFVPLDPNAPDHYLREVAEHTGVRFVFGRSIAGARSIDPHVSAETPRLSARSGAPGALVYVIHTSGTTGTPKGAANTEAGLANRVCWMQAEYALNASDAVLYKTPLTFDVSVWEFAWPLIAGARVVIAAPDAHRDAAELSRTIARHGVTTVHFVPSMLRVFIDEAAHAELRSLRRVIASGETLELDVVRAFQRISPAELHNLYGPTEASIDVSSYACPRPFPSDAATVPIGAPIHNTALYVLGEDLEPRAIGAPGELYLGGVGLARGYAQKPRATAERFLPDPYATTPGARMYRTGDRARVRADGSFEHLGRLDAQVKLRGFRIELEGIEDRLRRHPAVRAAAVQLVRGDTLAAFIAGGAPVETEELRAFLTARLPAHEVPSLWFHLDALPLTRHGKLDRAKLDEHARASVAEQAIEAYVAPRTPAEELVANIFASVLELPRFSVEKNFFDAGGHSIVAMRVVSRIRSIFAIALPARAVFDHPTAASLALHLRSSTRGARDDGPTPRGPIAEVPLSFSQNRLWFLDQFAPGGAVYNLPLAITLSGALDADRLRRSIDAVVARHEALRTTFPVRGGRATQQIHPPQPAPFEQLDLRGEPDPHAASIEHAVEMFHRPFELARGPLLRSKLLRVGAEEHLLVICVHHIVADGASLEVLHQEIAAIYEGRELPPLAIQFADYTVWQAARWRDEALGYWLDKLAGLPEPLELPCDRPPPKVRTFAGDHLPIEISPELAERVRALSRASGCTIFMTLFAALNVLLSRYTQAEDLVVGVPIANRDRPELDALIGYFANTLVLRTDLSGSPSFETLLRRVRETALGAYAHQDVSFEKVVEAIAPQRSGDKNPLFQVAFVMLPPPRSSAFAGLELALADVPNRTSKFDFSLVFADVQDTIVGHLEYSTELFDASTARRLIGHYIALLTSAVEHPERAIRRLEMLSQEEKQSLLGWSGAR